MAAGQGAEHVSDGSDDTCGALGKACDDHSYAGLFVAISVPAEQLRRGAELMYYGGDIAEMLLAFAMVSTWRPTRRNGSAIRHVLGQNRSTA